MTTVTLWIMIIVGNYFSPAVVVDRFANQSDCLDAVGRYKEIDPQKAVCLRAYVARP